MPVSCSGIRISITRMETHPLSENNSQFVNAFTQYPDAEELNRDNTMNEVEEYFQYKVDIQPNMAVGFKLYYR